MSRPVPSRPVPPPPYGAGTSRGVSGNRVVPGDYSNGGERVEGNVSGQGNLFEPQTRRYRGDLLQAFKPAGQTSKTVQGTEGKRERQGATAKRG